MATAGQKDPGALLTIGELSQQLGVAQHILRYWETRFAQLKPMQRAGNRRYYRQADVELARKINRLLNHEGYTVRGVQKLLQERTRERADRTDGTQCVASEVTSDAERTSDQRPGIDVRELVALRDRLTQALSS